MSWYRPDPDAARRLADFLLKLAEDEQLQLRYLKRPREVMLENGVDSKLVDLVMKCDVRRIRKVLKAAGYEDEIMWGTGIILLHPQSYGSPAQEP